MTINKNQGQTLGHVGLYLHRPVFTHGRLYVIVSRVKKSELD
jgi:ATP-dependent DNA helicase PIF1